MFKIPDYKVKKENRSLDSSVNVSESECEIIDSFKKKKKRKHKINNNELDTNEFKKKHNISTMDSDCQRNTSEDNSSNLIKDLRTYELYLKNSLNNIGGLQTKTPANLEHRKPESVIKVKSKDVKQKNTSKSQSFFNKCDIIEPVSPNTKTKTKRETTIIKIEENILPKKKKHKKKAAQDSSLENTKKENDKNSSVNVSESECEFIDSPKSLKNKHAANSPKSDNNVSKKKHKINIMDNVIEDKINSLLNEHISKTKKSNSQIENNTITYIGNHYVENMCHENCKKKQKHSKKCKLHISSENSSLENEYISVVVTLAGMKHATNKTKDTNPDQLNISGSSCEIIESVNSSPKKKKKRKADMELNTSEKSTKKHKTECDVHENRENDSIEVAETKLKPSDQTQTKKSVEHENLNCVKSLNEESFDNISIKNPNNFSLKKTSLCENNEKGEDSGHESYSSNLDDPFSDNSEINLPKFFKKIYKSIEYHSTANNSLVLTENSCDPNKMKNESFKMPLSPITVAVPKPSFETEGKNQENICDLENVSENNNEESPNQKSLTFCVSKSIFNKKKKATNDIKTSPKKENSLEKTKGMSIFAEYTEKTEGSKSKTDLLVTEMLTDPEAINDEKEKLQRLTVLFPFAIPHLHSILTRTTTPSKQQLKLIKDLKIPVKTGSFSKEEDEKIIENWKELCKEHDLRLNPAGFLKFPHRMQKETKMDILRYLGHGLDDRLLNRIYIRFKHLLQKNHLNTGRFAPEEDKQILEFMNDTNSTRPFSDLAKRLGRTKISIEKRYDRLTANDPVIHWTPEMVDKFVKKMINVTKCGKLKELKDREFTTKEWRKLSKKMDGIPIKKLQRAWKVTIYPRLFSKNVDLKAMKEEMIHLLYDRKETDWRTVKWKEIAKNFKGFTGEKIYMMFKHLVYFHVPTNKRNNLEECLDFLKNKFLRYEEISTPQRFKKFVVKNDHIVYDNKSK